MSIDNPNIAKRRMQDFEETGEVNLKYKNVVLHLHAFFFFFWGGGGVLTPQDA